MLLTTWNWHLVYLILKMNCYQSKNIQLFYKYHYRWFIRRILHYTPSRLRAETWCQILIFLQHRSESRFVVGTCSVAMLKALVLGYISSSCCWIQLSLNLLSYLGIINCGCAGFNAFLGPIRPLTRSVTIAWLIWNWCSLDNDTSADIIMNTSKVKCCRWERSRPILSSLLCDTGEVEIFVDTTQWDDFDVDQKAFENSLKNLHYKHMGTSCTRRVGQLKQIRCSVWTS